MKKIVISVVLAVQMVVSSAFAAGRATLTFGIYPYDTPSQIYQSFDPLMKHLSRETGLSIRIVIAPNYMSHIINIGEGRVDLGFMGPSPYVKATDKFGGVELIARLLMRNNRNDRLVIVAHKDSGIKSLKDLRGKTFAFGDYQSYGSHFYPRFLLQKEGIKLRHLKSYDFLGSHSKVILAVSHKDFDAGGIREDIYEKYRDRPIRIIAGPFTIPPHVIVCSKRIPGSMKAKLKAILMNITDKAVLQSIDPALERFGPVQDEDFRQAREVLDYIEDR